MADDKLTSREVEEAYKYFESAHARNAARENHLKTAVTTPATHQNNLLAVLHNLKPQHTTTVKLGNSPLNSKEYSEFRDPKHLNQVSNSEGEKLKVDLSSRNFENVLKSLLRDSQSSTVLADSQPAEDAARERRRMEWIKKLFGGDNPVVTTTEDNALRVVGVLPKHPANVDNHTSPPTNLRDTLMKLNDVLEKLNRNIEIELAKANTSDAYIVLKMPVKQKTNIEEHHRRKRDIKAIDVNDKQSHTTKSPKAAVSNNSTKVSPGDTFKSKILAHLIDSFNEIKYKIAPLKKVKENHSSSDLYKIGYIAASVDTLEENLNSLMEELEKNKTVWDEHKIIEFFDRLKTSNRVLRTLMEYLEMLTDKKLIYAVNNIN